MIRRAQQEKREIKKAQRWAAKRVGASQGEYEPPCRDFCSQKQWEMAYDDANTVRLQFILWHHSGRLVDFVINLQMLVSRGWETIEYFDCCHGHCHLHPRTGEPRTVLRLDAVDHVQDAFREAERESGDRARIVRADGV